MALKKGPPQKKHLPCLKLDMVQFTTPLFLVGGEARGSTRIYRQHAPDLRFVNEGGQRVVAWSYFGQGKTRTKKVPMANIASWDEAESDEEA